MNAVPVVSLQPGDRIRLRYGLGDRTVARLDLDYGRRLACPDPTTLVVHYAEGDAHAYAPSCPIELLGGPSS